MKERRIYRSLLQNKCESFWMRKIDAEKSFPRQLWRSIDVLLGRSGVPFCDNIETQHHYFDAKVAGVRSSTDDALPPSFTTSSSDVHFTCFEPVTIDEVVAAVRVLPDESCALDPLLSPTLKSVIDVLAPFLTELFNRSLTTGCVPAVFKAAYISPRLKRSIWILRMCDPTIQSPIYQFFRSYLKDSFLASSLPISTQTVCYQDSSRRIELTTQRRPLC